MKYLVRMLAAVPMAAVGFSCIVLFACAWEYSVLSILLIAQIPGYLILCKHYEDTVHEVAEFFKKMADSILDYE